MESKLNFIEKALKIIQDALSSPQSRAALFFLAGALTTGVYGYIEHQDNKRTQLRLELEHTKVLSLEQRYIECQANKVKDVFELFQKFAEMRKFFEGESSKYEDFQKVMTITLKEQDEKLKEIKELKE